MEFEVDMNKLKNMAPLFIFAVVAIFLIVLIAQPVEEVIVPTVTIKVEPEILDTIRIVEYVTLAPGDVNDQNSAGYHQRLMYLQKIELETILTESDMNKWHYDADVYHVRCELISKKMSGHSYPSRLEEVYHIYGGLNPEEGGRWPTAWVYEILLLDRHVQSITKL